MVPPYICVRRRTAMRLKPKYAHDAIRSEDNTSSPEAWIRDLTEEGIEPNPGPRYISKNINYQFDKIESLPYFEVLDSAIILSATSF